MVYTRWFKIYVFDSIFEGRGSTKEEDLKWIYIDNFDGPLFISRHVVNACAMYLAAVIRYFLINCIFLIKKW